MGGLRDRGDRPDVQDLPERRVDQHVREHARQGLEPWRRPGHQPASVHAGYIGLQNHGGADTTQYRNIRVQDLTPGAATTNPTGMFTVAGDGRTRWSSARSTRPATSRRRRRATSRSAASRSRHPDAVAVPDDVDDAAAVIDTPAADRLGKVSSLGPAATLTPRGLSVPVACTGAMTGSAKLTVSARRQAAEARPPHARHQRRPVLGPAHGDGRAQAVLGDREAARGEGRPESIKLTLSVQMRDWGNPPRRPRRRSRSRR